jgi:predicted metal-dependent phosphoesterase TrpH
MPLIIDIHTHTYPTSDDSSLVPEQLIEEAKRIGLDGICITDHDGFWKPDDIAELSRQHDYLVLPGCEVTTEEGHLLVYGLDRYIFGMHRAAFVKKLVDDAGGVIVVAHPYRRNYMKQDADGGMTYDEMLDRACDNTVFAMSDAVEVLNGRGSAQENAFSRDVAKRLDMSGTGASDAHRLEDVGTFATEFHRPIHSLQDLVRELSAGRFNPVTLDRRGRPGVVRGSDGQSVTVWPGSGRRG